MADNGKGVALVTGSGRRRVGNTVARMLAERGYSIVIHYHTSAEAARATAAELGALGVNTLPLQADVTSDVELDRLFGQIRHEFGRLDVLVNAASVYRPLPLEQTKAADVRACLDVEVVGTFLCCQRAGLMMVEQPQGGLIVTIADWAIARPYLDYAAYLSAKGAIPTLTRVFAVELARRNPAVRVNCILPGPVMFPPDLPDEERQASIAGTLVQHEGSPENVGRAVLGFIDNDFITGVSLAVDGGRSIAGGA